MLTRRDTLEQMYRECASSCVATARWLRFGEPDHPGGTPQQRGLFEAVDSGAQYIAAKSGKGIGKTAATGVVGIHRLLKGAQAHDKGGVSGKVLLTAPKMDQCKIWLTELRTQTLAKAHPLMNRLVQVTRTSVIVAGEKDWNLTPLTASDALRMQGYHHKGLFIIFEEASGIERDMMEALWSTLTNDEGGGLWIGNPNLRDCFFFDCFHGPLQDRFAKLTFNAEESPLVSRRKIQEAEEVYGRDSDYFRVNIQGEFPRQSSRAMMSLEDCQACADLDVQVLSRQRQGDYLVRSFGIDFARFGDCENVIAERLGNAIIGIHTFSHTDPNDVAEKAMALQIERQWKTPETMYVADAGGMGQGVMRRFYDASKRVYEFQFGRKIEHPDYADEQTEAWFGLANRVKRHHVHLPKDHRLLMQLSTRQYQITKDGRVKVESKEDYEKRGHESPDRADAVVMAMFERAHARGSISSGQQGGSFFRPRT